MAEQQTEFAYRNGTFLTREERIDTKNRLRKSLATRCFRTAFVAEQAEGGRQCDAIAAGLNDLIGNYTSGAGDKRRKEACE